MGKIFAVWGPPQAGKTTLSLNLAHALSKNEKTVLLISPEEYSEYSALLGVAIPKEHSITAALSGKDSLKKAVFKVNEFFHILAAPVDADAFEIAFADDKVRTILSVAPVMFDYTIIDCPNSTTNNFSAWAMNKSDNLIVTYGGKVTHGMWATAHSRALNPLVYKSVYVQNETVIGFDYRSLLDLVHCRSAITLPHVASAPRDSNEKTFLYGGTSKECRVYSKKIDEIAKAVM